MADDIAVDWRKSSHSGAENCIEAATWRTARTCEGGGACIEVADGILVRDTTDRGGTVLSFPAGAWAEFTAGLKGGTA